MPKANIYVSVANSTTQSLDPSERIYNKPQRLWYISLEPKKHSIPCVPHKSSVEPLHYGAIPDQDSGLYRVQTHSATGEPMIIGNILVGEKAKTSSDQVLRILKEKLTTGSSDLPSEQTTAGDATADAWIRKALHLLQNEKILDTFDVGEFMTYAHAYAANRAEGEGQAMVAYQKLNKNHEKKAKSHNFWVDYPMASKPPPRDYIEGNQKKYGSLM